MVTGLSGVQFGLRSGSSICLITSMIIIRIVRLLGMLIRFRKWKNIMLYDFIKKFAALMGFQENIRLKEI